MSAARTRRDMAKRLGLKLAKCSEELANAQGEEEITAAAIVLGATFNENLEFICWCLKEFGGLEQPAYQVVETKH
jgi:hypothetical protein